MIINGVNTHVRVEGTGSPLVALHGFMSSSVIWSRDWFPPDTQLIAPDLLGHGQTESPDNYRRYLMGASSLDLADLIPRVATPPVTLLGYSMGGRLALDAALTYPQLIDKLILESASPGIEDTFERMSRRGSDYRLAERIERDGIATFVEYWENIPLFATQSPEMRDHLRPIRLAQNPIGLANSLRGMGTGAQPSLWSRLIEVQMPVLIIAGELDTKFITIARQMSEIIPKCTLAIIPNAGHTVHLEQPAAYADAIRQFLKV